MFLSLRTMCLWALLVALSCSAAQAASYTISSYNRPGALSTSFWDINNTGHVVGNSDDGLANSAFTYSDGICTPLAGPTGSIWTNAFGISDNGVIVGAYGTSLISPGFGFIYEGGNYATFNVSGAISTTLRGISPDGRYLRVFSR